jgi:hypothetical protein
MLLNLPIAYSFELAATGKFWRNPRFAQIAEGTLQPFSELPAFAVGRPA